MRLSAEENGERRRPRQEEKVKEEMNIQGGGGRGALLGVLEKGEI